MIALALGPLGGQTGVWGREGTEEGRGEGVPREESIDMKGGQGEAILIAKKVEERGEGGGGGEGDCARCDTPKISSLPDLSPSPSLSPPIHCEMKPLRSLFTPVTGRHLDRTFPFKNRTEGRSIDIDHIWDEIHSANKDKEINENCENCEILCSIL